MVSDFGAAHPYPFQMWVPPPPGTWTKFLHNGNEMNAPIGSAQLKNGPEYLGNPLLHVAIRWQHIKMIYIHFQSIFCTFWHNVWNLDSFYCTCHDWGGGGGLFPLVGYCTISVRIVPRKALLNEDSMVDQETPWQLLPPRLNEEDCLAYKYYMIS